MSRIKFTASIIRMDKACYTAIADELLIKGAPATTQRGAIRKLKDAVLAHLRQAAQRGHLNEFLDEAGYTGQLSQTSHVTLERHTWNSDDIILRIPRQSRRRPKMT